MSNSFEQKSDLDIGMITELNSIDSFNELPDWARIVDRRKQNPEREKRDGKIISFIDSTSSGIIERDLDEFNVLDEEVRTWMIKIILMADRQRERMELSLYSNDSILTLVYEIWYTANLHRNNVRQNGDNYAKSHLFGSVINAIRDQGVSDIFTIVAILKHDDLEDYKKLGFDKPRPDLLLCLKDYEHLMTGEEMSTSVDDQTKRFRKELTSTVEAVSIYKKFSKANKQQKHELNFRRALHSFAEYGMRPTNVRLAERGHNHATIDGKSEEEARAYLEHSLKVYPAFARSLDLHRAKENLVKTAYNYLEPDLLIAFNLKSAQRLNEKFGVVKDKSKLLALLKKVGRAQFIKFLAINPRKVSHYVKGGESFEGLDNIAENDPMFEILMLVEKEADLEKAKIRLEAFLKTSPEFLEVDLDYSRGAMPQKGIRLEILNPDHDHELGGYLKIRINTVADETRLDQGRIQTTESGNEDYEDFLRPIKEVLEKTERSARGILDMVDEIGRGKMDIFTPELDKISIPSGGTARAFAAKINTKLLWEMRGVRIEVKVEGNNGELCRVWRPISPFEQLRHKTRVKIIKERDKDGKPEKDFDPTIDTYGVNHSWFESAKSLDAQAVRRYLNSLPTDERHIMLFEYLDRLHNLVGLKAHEFMQVLLSKSDDHEVRKRFYESVMTPLHLERLETYLLETEDHADQEKLRIKIKRTKERMEKVTREMNQDIDKLLKDIDNGHLSPIKLIANAAEEQISTAEERGEEPIRIDENNPLLVYFEVPDREGVGDEFAMEFKKIQVSYRNIEQKRISVGKDRWGLSLDIRNPKTRVYDLLYVLLKLSDRYKCVELSGTFKKLLPHFEFGKKFESKPSEPQQSE